jgi:glycosyltransferase involved in cell wall biosynthesis
MSSKPRITIVAASLDILGGQGVQARSLVDALERDGFPVDFVPIKRVFPRGFRWAHRVRYLRTLVNQLIYVPGLRRLVSADVVHAFSASYWAFLLAPVPAMAVARLLGKRVVLHYHSGEAADHLANWGVLVHPWLRLAHEIVVPSEYLRGVFAEHGYRTRVIPNVVDLARFDYRDRWPLKPNLLSTRNLEPYYRVDVILEAFKRFRQQVPAATLTIAGYGSEEARLRRLAAALPSGAVRFAGRTDPESMPALYAAADIFVNASVVDNQPVSIIEALSAGLPVVSTPTGDIGFMVRDGRSGVIVPPDDAGALAEAIGAVWRNPHRARLMAREARKEAGRYSWPAVRQLWAEAYAC